MSRVPRMYYNIKRVLTLVNMFLSTRSLSSRIICRKESTSHANFFTWRVPATYLLLLKLNTFHDGYENPQVKMKGGGRQANRKKKLTATQPNNFSIKSHGPSQLHYLPCHASQRKQNWFFRTASFPLSLIFWCKNKYQSSIHPEGQCWCQGIRQREAKSVRGRLSCPRPLVLLSETWGLAS